MERAFITGRGLITPLGNTLPVNEEALRSGKSGITKVESFITMRMETIIGGLPDYEPDCGDLVDRKIKRFCPPVGMMSVAAVKEALEEAGLSREELAGRHIGLIGGQAGGNNLELCDSALKYVGQGYRLRSVSPFSVPRVMPSSAISLISLIFGIKGETYDISAACASSALSIMQATRLIRSGEYDIVLAGGAEQLDWPTAIGFNACRALSTHYNDTPEKSSRPFDMARDGFVLAGGAAYVVLESEKSVRARGVRPICEVSGIGANSNAVDMVVPDAASSAAVMEAAIANAGLKISDIDYINTHGTATPVGDKVEMEAIHRIVGDGRCPALNSTKSQTGHMVGATGAAEIIFSSMMMEKGFVSPTINLENPDPEFAWADLVRERRDNVKIRHALSNSFAFGGSNASVVISACDDF